MNHGEGWGIFIEFYNLLYNSQLRWTLGDPCRYSYCQYLFYEKIVDCLSGLYCCLRLICVSYSGGGSIRSVLLYEKGENNEKVGWEYWKYE